ncbi:hypothetical protein BAE44_0012785 [Dichanthelium oligosanthes]|uniref:Uncharacterized protein n=1 Tax=Dichanthelium oligosanthes TaxID=888268 RepID=A0A1E5VM54_9POAL|nr:hypothetical protein BAE44_0012785 [Dichanthelium oligosanthes]
MIRTFEKAPSLEVDKFLGALKKTTREVSSSRQKENETNFWPLDEVSLDYQHGKPFLYLWDLVEGPSEINKFHSWTMKAMKLGLRVVTANVPKIVYELVIDFEDLHALYRRKRLDMNLISAWCS